MGFSLKFDAGNHILLVIIQGGMTLDDIREFHQVLSTSAEYDMDTPILWDLTAMQAAPLDEVYLREAIWIERSFKRPKRGRQAYAVAIPEIRVLVERYIELSLGHGIDKEMRIFPASDLYAAIQWLSCEEPLQVRV